MVMSHLPGFVLLATIAAPAVASATAMSPDAIQIVFGAGHAFSAQIAGQTDKVTLNPDGTAMRTPSGAKTSEAGAWRLSSDGFCWKWSGEASERCYTINIAVKAASVVVADDDETLVVAGAGACAAAAGGLLISAAASPADCAPPNEWSASEQLRLQTSFEVYDSASHKLVGRWQKP